ncbi:Alpha/Beta hydrolase protein [Aspergillus ambiguus]|uniref:putative carboxylesterase n=1 Tax=Aspergillus ambiguus TaxID=176160 RepID=UPI003CCD0F08
MTTILQTKLLGDIRGKNVDGVTHYLGIKYATLKDRFADAELVETRQAGVLDATKDGPTAVSPLFGCDLELSAIQHTLPKKDLPQSDLDCLNLNISVPQGTTALSKLPVFLFIHGGGFVLGANSWPQFDYTRFVQLSTEKKLPIVAVSMNYRLGVFGFLTSDELRQAGYKANNGLRDQKVAMEWVQKHIEDFGGDPANVTLAGMSAGAASVTYHLNSERILFNRAIVMSGSYFLMQCLPYDVHEKNYQQAIAALGLTNASPDERVKTLLEMPGQDLIGKLPPSVLAAPAVDGDMVSSVGSFAETADRSSSVPKGKEWCKDLMIGDAQMDASIMSILMPNAKYGCAKKFITAMNTALSSHPNIAQEMLNKYGLAEDTEDEQAFAAVLNYINDISFFAPVLTFAQGWRGNSYVYYFNEGNPWDGPWKDRAAHILDLAYLFQNFREFMTPAQQNVATAFAEDFFKFCHGIAPWPSASGGDIETGFKARSYGPSSGSPTMGVVSQPYGGDTQRRQTLFEYREQVSFDDLARVLALFRDM